MSPSQQRRALGLNVIRIIGIFQGLFAFIVLISFIFYVWEQYYWLYEGSGEYDFITAFFASLMAAGIILAALLQRKVAPQRATTFYFEAVNAVLATGLWVWLMLDCLIVDRSRYDGEEKKARYKRRRVMRAALAVIVLVLFFLAPLLYAWYERRVGGDEDGEPEIERPGGEDESERTPLLARAQ